MNSSERTSEEPPRQSSGVALRPSTKLHPLTGDPPSLQMWYEHLRRAGYQKLPPPYRDANLPSTGRSDLPPPPAP